MERSMLSAIQLDSLHYLDRFASQSKPCTLEDYETSRMRPSSYPFGPSNHLREAQIFQSEESNRIAGNVLQGRVTLQLE